ncbi:MAG: alpha amylase C-terminal domain-containing protein, partial [Muribaculaceae bacterium]|nr:alpha amylase C-terminal domain-containing protein [Muribaculaceae bacterium]
PGFNPDRQYAFLRRGADALLLVVANFSSEDAQDLTVRIPAHAFDVLALPQRQARATELLTGRRSAIAIERDGYVRCPVAAHGAAIWRIPLPRTKKAPADGSNSPEIC